MDKVIMEMYKSSQCEACTEYGWYSAGVRECIDAVSRAMIAVVGELFEEEYSVEEMKKDLEDALRKEVCHE